MTTNQDAFLFPLNWHHMVITARCCPYNREQLSRWCWNLCYFPGWVTANNLTIVPALIVHHTSKGSRLSVTATKTAANILIMKFYYISWQWEGFSVAIWEAVSAFLWAARRLGGIWFVGLKIIRFLSDFESSNWMFGSEGSVKVKPGLITPVGEGQKNCIFAWVMHIAHHSIIFVWVGPAHNGFFVWVALKQKQKWQNCQRNCPGARLIAFVSLRLRCTFTETKTVLRSF